jgi:hypothetical protein
MQQYLFEFIYVGWFFAQEVFLGIVQQYFEWLDLMAFMSLCVAVITDDTLMAAGGLEADEVEQFSAMLLAALALRVLELLCHLLYLVLYDILEYKIVCKHG